MTEILVLKYLHLIAFVYWLGGDLGTFIAGRHVAMGNLSPQSRAVALRIMLACDQAPKASMPLILPLGLQLTQAMGLTALPTALIWVMWGVALLWSVNVQYLYFAKDHHTKTAVTRLDYGVRVAVILALVICCIGSLLGKDWIRADWVVWKTLIFASMVAAGLMIRVRIKPFVDAFSKMMNSGADPQLDAIMVRSMWQVRPFVFYIWGGLFVNAALGLHLL